MGLLNVTNSARPSKLFIYVLLYLTDGSIEDELLDGFPNVETTSGGAVIGGSFTSGVFVFIVLLYILYRVLKDYHDRRVNPITNHDSPANQTRAICPRCNHPSSPNPPPYEVAVQTAELAEFACACMSVPPVNSKQPTIMTLPNEVMT